MNKSIIKYISLTNGRCGLTIDSPEEILRAEGENNVRYVRNATADEVAWVKAMGGTVPDGRIAKENP